MSKVLGLDLAYRSTGYALVSNRKIYRAFIGTIKTTNKQSFEESALSFWEELEGLLRRIDKRTGSLPDIVVIESTPIKQNFKTNKKLSMFEAIARVVLYLEYGEEFGSRVFIEPVSTIRSSLALSSKEDVFDFVVGKYKLKNLCFERDNDITDAVACALHGLKLKEV
jgi:Holliday junction resolvasome RuvABC endonuclease subunit